MGIQRRLNVMVLGSRGITVYGTVHKEGHSMCEMAKIV
jgi:hypothetical protein